MIRINLLKPETKDIKETAAAPGTAEVPVKKARNLGSLVFLLLVVALGAYLYVQQRAFDRENELLATARLEKEKLQYVTAKLEQQKLLKASLERKINLINDLRSQQDLAARIMDQLSRSLPDWVWLSEVSLRRQGPPGQGQGPLEQPHRGLHDEPREQPRLHERQPGQLDPAEDAEERIPRIHSQRRDRKEAGGGAGGRIAPAADQARREERGDDMKSMPWYGSVIICVVIFALAHLFYFSPQNTKLQALRADRVKIESEVKDLKQKKKELDRIEQELVVMTAQLKGLESIIPQRKEQAEILRQIQQLAYDARLDVTNFTQQKEVGREFYAEWPIVVQVTGTYNNLGTYFDRLSQYARLFTIDKFSVKALSRQTDQSTISANWTAKTYLFLEEPTAPAPKPKAKRPGR